MQCFNIASALPISSFLRNDIMSNSDSISTKPCIKCGETERSAAGRCKACARAASAAWAKANPDRVKANNTAWKKDNTDRLKSARVAYRAAHPIDPDKARAIRLAWRNANIERERARGRAWKKANPEKVNTYNSAWAKANPEVGRIKLQNRRARKLENGGILSRDISDKLFKLQKGKCACCGKPLGDNYHMDHIMPLSLGGSNTDDNIQLLRQRCNNQKHTKHPVDFMQERGFLL